MRLKRLEIYGFKSFADRTVIRFEEGITGIVGPNGSGKSNLSDAVRWVLGEQSAKSLRGGRMEDVIFNGTESRRRLGTCEVSLVIDNEDHELPTDYAEVMITRRVYRTGESEYYINKSACRMKDILELFQDTGIGKDGYSIVGQGRIDAILSQKSEDRRGIFEEAAGIVKYRTRVAESEKRLASTEENLSRIGDLIDDLESRLEPLKKASETARRFLAMRDELRVLECTLFVRTHDENEEKIARLRERIDDLRSQSEDEEKRIEAGQASRQEESGRLTEIESVIAGMRGDFVAVTRQTEALRGSLALLQSEMAGTEKEAAQLSETNDEAAERLREIDGEEKRNEARIAQIEEELTALGRSAQQQREAVSACQEALAAAEAEYEKNQSAVILAMNRRTDVKSAEARLSALRQQLEQRLSGAKEEQGRFAENAEGIAEQIGEAGRAVDGLQEREREVLSRQCALEEQIRASTDRIAGLYAALDAARAERSGQESRLRVLEDMVRDYAGYQQPVKKVLQRYRGDERVCGIVAELIHAPKELEKAIEAVLGGALQNIVTVDEYAARDMISFLKSNNLGRATFLPLTSVRGKTVQPHERGILAHPGCVGVASELIRFDERYRGIAENLLGRTLIAENLDAGIEIMRSCRYAFRLATLDGDVMHSGGSMTGGSASSRMTSLLSRDREIAEHRAGIRALGERIDGVQREIESARERKARDTETLNAEAKALEALRIEESVAKERIALLHRQMEEENERIAKNRELREQIEEMLSDVERQFTELRASQETDPVQDEELHKQTQTLAEQLQRQRQTLEEEQNRLHDLEIRTVAAEKDGQGARQEQRRLREERLTLSGETVQREEKIHDLILLHQEKQMQLAGVSSELAACEEKEKGMDSALREREKERERISNAISGLTDGIEAGRKRVSAFAEQIHRTELQLGKAEAEVSQLGQRVWEEYELTYAGAREYARDEFEPGRDQPRIQEIRRALKDIGTVNFTATEEYNACRERYDGLIAQREDMQKARQDLEGIIRSLRKEMELRFLMNFRLLQTYLQEAFSKLFGGGKAELRLTDEGDVLGSGIEIAAQPPGKKLQLLSLLSGGERALTAIAILFAMLKLKPTPFCFLDEIEAALDDGNIETFARYLQDFSKNTQFVIITHRKGTMEHCNSLYGISMEEKGISKLLSVELKDIEEMEE